VAFVDLSKHSKHVAKGKGPLFSASGLVFNHPFILQVFGKTNKIISRLQLAKVSVTVSVKLDSFLASLRPGIALLRFGTQPGINVLCNNLGYPCSQSTVSTH
jgi:hypothetical protein